MMIEPNPRPRSPVGTVSVWDDGLTSPDVCDTQYGQEPISRPPLSNSRHLTTGRSPRTTDAFTQTELDLTSYPQSVTEDDGKVSTRNSSASVEPRDQAFQVLSRSTPMIHQIGVARVRIESISLTQQRSEMEEGDEDSTCGSSVECVDRDEQEEPSSSEHYGTDKNSNDNTAETGGSPTTGCQATSNCNAPQRRRRRGRDDGDENERRKKRSRMQPNDITSVLQGRFACPYQAYETWRDCFRAGPRNITGGCDGIKRLK